VSAKRNQKVLMMEKVRKYLLSKTISTITSNGNFFLYANFFLLIGKKIIIIINLKLET